MTAEFVVSQAFSVQFGWECTLERRYSTMNTQKWIRAVSLIVALAILLAYAAPAFASNGDVPPAICRRGYVMTRYGCVTSANYYAIRLVRPVVKTVGYGFGWTEKPPRYAAPGR